MARRHSAGILAYRFTGQALQVFLVHPGGPIWARREQGAWSIPKGEHGPDEPALQAARREFAEETGLALPEPAIALTPVRQGSGKWVEAFAVFAPELDPTQLRSNLFALEWPPHSGQRREYPEVDRAAWFSLDSAGTYLLAGQRPLLAELARRVASGELPVPAGAATLAGREVTQ